MVNGLQKTLHYSKESNLIIWICYVNENLYDISVTDKLTHITYKLAEYDGYKYTILNNDLFDRLYYHVIKENPLIIATIRSFIYYHKPESRSFKDMCDRLTNKYELWLSNKKNQIKRIWKNSK